MLLQVCGRPRDFSRHMALQDAGDAFNVLPASEAYGNRPQATSKHLNRATSMERLSGFFSPLQAFLALQLVSAQQHTCWKKSNGDVLA